jgi:PDZ domain-containing secreted protein
MRFKVLLLLMCLSVNGLLLAQDNNVAIATNWNEKGATKTVAETAYLGVTYNGISKKKAKKLNFTTSEGIYVTRITKGSAAAEAGIRAFEYITGMNGQSFSEDIIFSEMMDETKTNQTVKLDLIRQGKPMTITATLKARPAKTPNLYEGKYAFLGVSPSHNELPEGIEGARVSEIVSNSTAQAMGMKGNDIIQFINDNPILEWHDINTAMKNTAKGDDLKVVFYRESDQQTRTKTMTAVRHGEAVTPPVALAKVATPSESMAEVTDIAVVEMANVSEAESEEMEAADIDMPVINTLAVDNLRLFPNPNNGIFNLNFTLNGQDDVNIRVFSAEGRVIYEENLGAFSGEYLDKINISNNARGIYFLQVRQGQNVLSKKIILK